MLPVSWNGSVTLYRGIIRPFVLKHQKQIDEGLDTMANVAGKIADEGKTLFNRYYWSEISNVGTIDLLVYYMYRRLYNRYLFIW